MKKNQQSNARTLLNSFVQKQEPTKKTAPKKEKFLQPYEQTGAELEETLSPETQELLQLRRGRPRYKRQEDNGYLRTSFILRATQLEKLRAIAQRERVTLKAVVEEAFRNAIDTYEQRNGNLELSTLKGSATGLFSE